MQRFIDDNRPDPSAVVKTLFDVEGRAVDCIDIMSQPALNGGPLETPPTTINADPVNPAASDLTARLVDADGNADTCASGTVPRPQLTLDDLLRFETLDDFLRKENPEAPAHSVSARGEAGLAEPRIGSTASHQYYTRGRDVTNWGAEADMIVYNPYVYSNSEFSLGQIWVTGGSYPSTLQTVEAGSQHFYNLYGDSAVHLFIFSTKDAYVSTGCYNNSCSDFVQYSSTVYPGQYFTSPATCPSGASGAINGGYMDLHWMKAGDTGSWWLSMDGAWIGYYPRGGFLGSYSGALANHADHYEFGGEITNAEIGGVHTYTDMGTGYNVHTDACNTWMRRLRWNDSNPSGSSVTWAWSTGLSSFVSDTYCYDGTYAETTDPNWMTYLTYGGPGYNTNCQ